MPNAKNITRYAVDALVNARKFASSQKVNTLGLAHGALGERCLRVDLRRVDSPVTGISLEFYSRIMTRELSGVRTVQRPSAALMWHGKRIRGLDHSITHPVVENGIIIGAIKGWHEHYWTDQDEDRRIRTPNLPLQNHDIQSVITWACRNWNIEGLTEQLGLFQ